MDAKQDSEITFPEISVSHNCSPSGFVEFVSIHKCGNMDAYEINITYRGEPIALHITRLMLMHHLPDLTKLLADLNKER